MKKSDAFLLNHTLVIAGFVCSLNGREKLGMVLGMIAILFSQHSLSQHVLKKDWIKIIVLSFGELLFGEITRLTYFYPSIYFLSLASLIVAFTWNHAGYKAKRYGMKWLSIVGIVFVMSSLIMPYQRFGMINTLYIVIAIFLPSNILYFVSQCSYNYRVNHRKENLTVVKY